MLGCEQLIVQCCREVADLPGDVAEIGVWRGESARVILRELPNCTVHLFDTFKGMPKEMVSGVDIHAVGEFNDTSFERVKTFLGSRPVYHVGVFPQTAEGLKVLLKFVHIDCDLYLSTKAALDWCWPLMVAGGVILHDDYDSVPGAKRAMDRFLGGKWAGIETSRQRAIIRGAYCAN